MGSHQERPLIGLLFSETGVTADIELLDHHQPGDGNCTTYLASLEHERVRFVRR